MLSCLAVKASFKRKLERAESQGYLAVGSDTEDELLKAWWQRCRDTGRLFSLEVERIPGHPCQVTLRTLEKALSLKAIGELALVGTLFERGWSMDTGAPDCIVWEIERRYLSMAVELISRLMGHERRRVELNAAYFPAEGLAVCVDNEGMEHLLKLGETVYLRELPNMRGHCLILAEGRHPIFGYHLERFRMDAGHGLPKRRRSYPVGPTPWPSRHLFWMELEGRWRCFEGRAPN